MVNGIMDFEFQDNCVDFLIDKTSDPNSKQVITIKAPTGAGKTVMLIKYVDEYLKNTSGNIAFVWLCPGKGDLEQQSMDKMDELTPQRDTRNLLYSMLMGFEAGSVTFINWELVTKKGNTALKDGEKTNLFEMIAAAHKDGVQFVVIIDEEHLNNTKKADDIIRAFAAKNIIRVSATAQKVDRHEFYEIPEDEVINAGLITRAIYVNEGVDERRQITNDYEYLLELADEKRKEIQAGYDAIKTNIRPLILIQFPMGQPETIAGVEAKLESMGYTYDNGMVSIWMSDAKKNINGLIENDGSPAFLLMKQAISTGWDCPRAKILVKLREGGSEDFQIQTIGRIRRMPERKHYGLNTLDYCYIYTLDSNYKRGLLSSMDKAYQVRRLFARNETKSLVLTKELRNLDFDGLGERETLEKVYEYFKKKYNLGSDMRVNRENLEAGGYNFDHEIDSKILHIYIEDEYIDLKEEGKINSSNYEQYLDGNFEVEEYYFYQELYNSMIKDEIAYDLNDLALFDDKGNWDFYITFEELKRVGYGFMAKDQYPLIEKYAVSEEKIFDFFNYFSLEQLEDFEDSLHKYFVERSIIYDEIEGLTYNPISHFEAKENYTFNRDILRLACGLISYEDFIQDYIEHTPSYSDLSISKVTEYFTENDIDNLMGYGSDSDEGLYHLTSMYQEIMDKLNIKYENIYTEDGVSDGKYVTVITMKDNTEIKLDTSAWNGIETVTENIATIYEIYDDIKENLEENKVEKDEEISYEYV